MTEGKTQKMNIVVTGGAGFIGSHLVDNYIKNGHKVTVIDDLSNGCKDWVHPKAGLLTIKLTDPYLDQLIFDIKPDLINHHAAHIDVRKSVQDPMVDLEANLLGTIHLLKAIGRSGVKRIIFSSTGGAIYGECLGAPIPETHSLNPISPYGINKLTAEFYINYYAKMYGFQWIILRYANVYGPRQGARGEGGVISIFIDRLNKGLKPIIFGDGEQVRDFIHVQDIVDANMLFSRFDGISNDTFNVGTGVGTSLNDLLKILSNFTPHYKLPIYEEAKPGDIQRSILSIDKLKSLGWSPKIPLEKGLCWQNTLMQKYGFYLKGLSRTAS